MNKRQKRIFKILQTLALSSEGVKSSRHAAAVVYKGDIVAFGQNSWKTHPFQSKYSKHEKSVFIHSETHAIYNALKKLTVEELKKCTLYVLRLNKHGVICHSKPCEGCSKCIRTFGIKQCFYTSEAGLFVQ